VKVVLYREILLHTLITLVAFRATAVPQATNTSPTQHTLGSRTHSVGLPNFGEVTPNLFRGGQPGVDGLEALEKMGVRMIVDMRGRRSSHEKLPFPNWECNMLPFLGIAPAVWVTIARAWPSPRTAWRASRDLSHAVVLGETLS